MQKNQSLEKIFTTIDCGVIRHTTDGKELLSINRAALEILGYESQEELMVDGFDMIEENVLDEDKEKLRECIKKLKKKGTALVRNTVYSIKMVISYILWVILSF